MPNYLMSLFLLLVNICKDLETLMNEFFWHNGIRLLKVFDSYAKRDWLLLEFWVVLAIYRDLQQFNLALLAKQGWHILKHSESLAS